MSQSRPSILKSKMYWIGILYFAEGFPLGVFYDFFPVHFRQQGVELWEIGFMSLLGLAWTLKFLWAPAVDHYRHHRRWMATADLVMGAVMLAFAIHLDFSPWMWFAIAVFTLASATNDIAIDGYTIEMLKRREMGLANGLRIGMYRVGMLAAGFALVLSDFIGWTGTYLAAGLLFLLLGVTCLRAPMERRVAKAEGISLRHELRGLSGHPLAFGAVVLFLLGAVWLADRAVAFSSALENFWPYALAAGTLLFLGSFMRRRHVPKEERTSTETLTRGPMFGAMLDMLRRPYMVPVILFVLLFKLGDSSMGFMVKPFWVDAGFSATQIGLFSVNLGLVMAIAGGIVGGWITDRIGIFRALWVLGAVQAASNLGYAWAAAVVPYGEGVAAPTLQQMLIMYTAGGLESFTGGLGTSAFLAFLMAIVNKRHSATEYALLSSIFALSRSVAGWASGFGASIMGYADYFLLTFFLAFPAFLLLPWALKMLRYAESRSDWQQR